MSSKVAPAKGKGRPGAWQTHSKTKNAQNPPTGNIKKYNQSKPTKPGDKNIINTKTKAKSDTTEKATNKNGGQDASMSHQENKKNKVVPLTPEEPEEGQHLNEVTRKDVSVA